MSELQRVTTEYVDVADRIRVTGELPSGQPVVLWLTMRLLNRLLPPVLQWLERSMPDVGHAQMMLGFEQQAARAALEDQAPVLALADSDTWLVIEIDVNLTDQQLQLRFKGEAPKQQVALTLDGQSLHQWLNILHEHYRLAEWPMAVWPAWMDESKAPEPARPLASMH
jgi:hypothetical protein